jgi:hypothetical protein
MYLGLKQVLRTDPHLPRVKVMTCTSFKSSYIAPALPNISQQSRDVEVNVDELRTFRSYRKRYTSVVNELAN